MSVVLLDTTVASFLHSKKKYNTYRVNYEAHMASNILALNFQSVAELWAWAEENNWGDKQKFGLETFLRSFLIIPYDADLAKSWAKVKNHCKKIGRRLESGDAWIVSNAVHYKIFLLTHDKDLVGLSIPDLHVISYA